MHYTSIENIHKVIDPLFLDGLRSELEEIKEIAVDKTRKASPEVVVEHTLAAEDTGVLGVQAEHQPDAQSVQAFQRVLGLRGFVLLQQGIVEDAHDLARLQGDFHLFLDIGVPGVYQELQAVVFFFQIAQLDDLRGLYLADFIDCSGKMRSCMVSCKKSNWGNTAMTDTQRRAAAKQFAADWQGKGYEKGHSQTQPSEVVVEE